MKDQHLDGIPGPWVRLQRRPTGGHEVRRLWLRLAGAQQQARQKGDSELPKGRNHILRVAPPRCYSRGVNRARLLSFRAPRAFPLLVALVLGAALGACDSAPEDTPERDIYALPGTTTGWYDQGPVTQADPTAFLDEGGDCTAGVFECRWDLGCVNDTCGTCETSDDCRDNQACVGGECGACTTSEQCATGMTCIESFCMQETLPRWELEVAQQDLAAMNIDPWTDIWVPARLTVDGVLYEENVTTRYLGSSTRSLPKKSFRIDFPEYAVHPGFQRKIKLRAEYNDPSTIRNFLAYETFRRFTRIPTPRTRYVNFFLNGEDKGVMLEVERIGGKFLGLNGRDREAPMYEVARTHEYGAFVPLNTPEEYAETYSKTTGDDADWSDLYELIEGTMWADWAESSAGGPTSTSRTGDAVDLDSYAQLLAVMGLLQSQEHVTQNMYFSMQDRGQGAKWEFYPWDLDLTLGCKWNEVEQNALCGDIVTDGWWLEGVIYSGLAVGSPNTCWCNMAINLTLFDPGHGTDFTARTCDMLEQDWWTTRGPRLTTALATMLTPYVRDDTSDRNPDLDAFLAATASVRDFMELRAAYLSLELGCF